MISIVVSIISCCPPKMSNMDFTLLPSQIQESCRLALPEGLKDLMSDISREVLRAQPQDLCTYIADYLAAMLETRDALTIACRICRDVCKCSCKPELEVELRNLGLTGEDLETAKDVVLEHFNMDEVNEGMILMNLLRRTQIDAQMLPSIQRAIRVAFIAHHRYHLNIKIKSAATEAGHIAADHTLMFYKNLNGDKDYMQEIDKQKKNMQSTSSKETTLNTKMTQSRGTDILSSTKVDFNKEFRLSSTCLAGSFIDLPKYVPYSVHRRSQSEEFEQEIHKNIDYLCDNELNGYTESDNERRILYDHSLHSSDINRSCEAETEEYVEEEISEEELQSEADTVDEDIKEETSEFAHACKRDKISRTQITYVHNDSLVITMSKRNLAELAAIEGSNSSNVFNSSTNSINIETDSYDNPPETQTVNKDSEDKFAIWNFDKRDNHFGFEKKGVSFSNLRKKISEESITNERTAPKKTPKDILNNKFDDLFEVSKPSVDAKDKLPGMKIKRSKKVMNCVGDDVILATEKVLKVIDNSKEVEMIEEFIDETTYIPTGRGRNNDNK